MHTGKKRICFTFKVYLRNDIKSYSKFAIFSKLKKEGGWVKRAITLMEISLLIFYEKRQPLTLLFYTREG